MAARDAQATIEETLESLLAQSLDHWEAVIVDDGSRDGTGAILARLAAADPRLRVLETSGVGVSAARNLGLENASADWILFLDADDWLAPDGLARLHAVTAAPEPVDIVHGRWQFVLPGGERLPPAPPPPKDLFPVLARTDPLPIHSCLQRRELLRRLGGFDSSLTTCEDWDLFQRVARAGARFAAVPEIVAFYRLRADSAMSRGAIVMADAVRVVERGHGADDRVPDPDPLYADGVDPTHMAAALLATATWMASLAVGRGVEFAPILAAVRHVSEPALDADLVAAAIVDGVPRGALVVPSEWPRRWGEVRGGIHELLGAVESAADAPGLAKRAASAVERLALEAASPSSLAAIGSAAAMELELTAPCVEIVPPAGVERLRLSLLFDGAPVGAVQLPVCDGSVRPEVVADAAAHAAAWEILGPFLASTLYPPDADPDHHDRVGWTTLLREVWGEPDLDDEDFYRGRTQRGRLARVRSRLRAMPAIRRRSRPAREPLELSAPLRALRGPADLVVQAGGAELGIVTLPMAGRIAPGELRAQVNTALGMELCRAVVREAVIGRPTGAPGLRERLRQAAAKRVSVPTDHHEHGTLVLGRRAPYEIGSSAARRAALPAGAADELRRLARALGEPLAGAVDGRVGRVAYVPELVGSDTGRDRDAFSPRGSPGPDADGPGGARVVPVLMYHRVSPTAGRASARWHITPDQLEEHLAFLRSEGFRWLSLEAWHDAILARRPVARRSVCITFDDAYVDFAEAAWPLLGRYGLNADLFVVTGEVGGWNRWDAELGERVPLLDWDQLALLRDEGVLIGAHSVSHRPLAALSPVDAVRELAGSRAEVRERLGVDARAFAYPYGDFDPALAHLAGACGFRQAVTCLPWASTLSDSPLALPRLEVASRTGVEELAAMLAPAGS